MSELQVIESALQRAARRRLDCALNGFVRGLPAGGVTVLLALAVYNLALDRS